MKLILLIAALLVLYGCSKAEVRTVGTQMYKTEKAYLINVQRVGDEESVEILLPKGFTFEGPAEPITIEDIQEQHIDNGAKIQARLDTRHGKW